MMAIFYWDLDTESGENLSILGRHVYGIPRDKAEPDDVYRARIRNVIAGFIAPIDGFVYHDEVVAWHPTKPEKPKAPKYPNECPCGIAAVRCEYHKDL